MTSFLRPNISQDVARELRDRVVDGRFPPGQRLNEVRLAEELGVSRTPLREALTTLVAEGFLTLSPRRGFFAKQLTEAEAADLYPLRALLDPEALRLAGIPPADQLRQLTVAHEELVRRSAGDDPSHVIDLDDAWHRLLIQHCPNRLLLALIEDFMARSRMYEHAYMRDHRNLSVALEEHQAILDALQRNDLTKACQALAENMASSRQPILQWLRQRETTTHEAETT